MKCYKLDEKLNLNANKENLEDKIEKYKDDEIKAIYDISGGDIANEILPYLDLVSLFS